MALKIRNGSYTGGELADAINLGKSLNLIVNDFKAPTQTLQDYVKTRNRALSQYAKDHPGEDISKNFDDIMKREEFKEIQELGKQVDKEWESVMDKYISKSSADYQAGIDAKEEQRVRSLMKRAIMDASSSWDLSGERDPVDFGYI